MRLIVELKRRNVFRVAIAYLVFGWLVLQVADVVFPALQLPDWSITLVAVLLAIGFVPAMIFAWAYELTPEGLKRESEVDRSKSVTHQTARRLDLITIAMVVIAAVVLVADRLWFEQPAKPQLADTPHDYSIAVLPFDDLSDTQDQEYFSDGLTEELLNRLAKVEGFRVAGRTSAFAFRDRPDDLRVIGEKLNVATILEGSVRKDGDQLRITAQLINVADGYHLWSETYDRRLENVFQIQDDIALAVVDALRATLMGDSELPDFQRTATTETAAFQLYLQVRQQLWKRRPDSLATAEELFERVIAADDRFAPAYAGFATALLFQTRVSDVDVASVYPRTDAALRQALALDPHNSDALASLGLLYSDLGRLDAARDAYEQAIASNPNNALAYRWLGASYNWSDPARYLDLARKAYEIDRLDPTMLYHHSVALSYFGRNEEALAVARELRTLAPESSRPYELAGSIERNLGRLDRALASYHLAYRTAPDQTEAYRNVPPALMGLDETELAQSWSDEIRKRTPEREYVLFNEAPLAFQRGRPDQAIQWFTQAAARLDNPYLDQWTGWALMIGGQFGAAREAMERSLLEPGLEHPHSTLIDGTTSSITRWSSSAPVHLSAPRS